MKTLITTLMLLASFCIVDAGGPDLEIAKARVDKVIKVRGQIVIQVSGIVRYTAAKADGGGKTVTLVMNKGEIRCMKGLRYAVKSPDAYEKRLRELEGTIQYIQIWGATTVLNEGEVSRITARIVNILLPRESERLHSTQGNKKLDK